jgi:hypothetical protein
MALPHQRQSYTLHNKNFIVIFAMSSKWVFFIIQLYRLMRKKGSNGKGGPGEVTESENTTSVDLWKKAKILSMDSCVLQFNDLGSHFVHPIFVFTTEASIHKQMACSKFLYLTSTDLDS